MTRGERLVGVVTDSTADLTKAMVEAEGITVVPLSVTIAGETMPDGQLSQREFFERMNAAPQLPTTSQPPVGAFVEAYEALLDEYETLVSVHISSRLSGTIESARQAAERFGDRVRIIDSKTLSFALGFQALAAARAADEGLSLDAVIERVESVRDRARLYVGLDRLDNLAKGGRIGRVTALLGGMLDLKVSFTVDEGAFSPIGRDRGPRAALKRTLEWVADQMGGERRGRFCVMHAQAEDKAAFLRDALEREYEALEMHVVETGTVIAAHTGTGWGVSFVPGD